jgi:hypothetical protein
MRNHLLTNDYETYRRHLRNQRLAVLAICVAGGILWWLT